jgi:hypothetical protein
VSLDIAILGHDGSPGEQVGIAVETHWRLMEVIKKRSDSILLRMDDYYEDAHFEAEEVNIVIREIEPLCFLCKGDVELANFLISFKDLATAAKAQGKPLEVLAD